MLIVDSEWVGCDGILPRIACKELFLLSPAHDGTATHPASCAVQVTELWFSLVADLRLPISDACELVSVFPPSAHE